MRSTAIIDYIICGAQLRYLRDAESGWSIHRKDCILDNINRFLNNLNEFDLNVTLRASYNIQQIRDELSKKSKDATLTKDEAKRLSEEMDILEPTLISEASGNIAFIVTDKRIDINKLLNNLPSLMAPETFEQLPEIAKYDFTEAGKCIAFERPTAAAFHILRATEAILRELYCK